MIDFVQGTQDVLVLIVLFGFTIFVHELGHFLVALACGMTVDTFSIGFGPALWKRSVRGIVYKIGWIPFGGYVAIPQLDPSGMSTLQGNNEPTSDPSGTPPERELPSVPAWKRMAVAVAGPLGNVLFALILAYVIYTHPGAVTGAAPALIGSVETNSVAYANGVRPGDLMLAVNGTPVSSWYRYVEECILGANKADEVELTLLRNGVQTNAIVPVNTEQPAEAAIGIGRSSKCVFVSVQPGSAEDLAGLKPGDILNEIDGKPVAGEEHLAALNALVPGPQHLASITRNGQALSLNVTLPLNGLDTLLPCIVGAVVPDKPAQIAGVRTGDVITGFAGQPVFTWQQFTALVQKGTPDPTPITVLRDGRELTLSVAPVFNAEHQKLMIGIELGFRSILPWMRFREPLAQIKGDVDGVFRVLRALVTPKESRKAAGALGGPLMIFAALWASIKISILNAVGFLRFLNVNLAILNLLPIPVLDGGHILFALTETVTRRKNHPKLVNALVNAFATLLIIAMLVITWRDLQRFFPNALSRSKDKPTTEKVEQPATEPTAQPDNHAPKP